MLPSLGEVIATDRTTVDLADPDATRRAVREAKPQIVLNAAAYTGVDKAESDCALAMQVNGIAPGLLGEEAKRLGALLVHYSTDYVFNGEKRLPYTEGDPPDPLSHYGRTKLEGERTILVSGCRHLILRTSWVYGPRASNFYQLIARKAAAGEPMRMVEDQTSVPTSSNFVAEYTVALLRKGASGLLNLVPSGQATRYTFARKVVVAMHSSSQVQPARTSEFPAHARRPAYSVLSNFKTAQVLGAPLPDWQSVLDRCVTEWLRDSRASGPRRG